MSGHSLKITIMKTWRNIFIFEMLSCVVLKVIPLVVIWLSGPTKSSQWLSQKSWREGDGKMKTVLYLGSILFFNRALTQWRFWFVVVFQYLAKMLLMGEKCWILVAQHFIKTRLYLSISYPLCCGLWRLSSDLLLTTLARAAIIFRGMSQSSESSPECQWLLYGDTSALRSGRVRNRELTLK